MTNKVSEETRHRFAEIMHNASGIIESVDSPVPRKWDSMPDTYKQQMVGMVDALLESGEAAHVNDTNVADMWQPIETAPRDGSVFLAVNSRGTKYPPNPYMLCFSTADADGVTYAPEAGWKQVGRDWPAYPTHWTPLPTPPKPEQEKE